ncbi:MAG TPA: DUF2147 domain-containing protein [Myxococcota bacterium]|nr:DUF2147 domain-containing protein [Myxococcota bacterium]
MPRTALASALLALLLSAAAPAGAAPDIAGRWLTASGNVEVDIQPCGAALCGTIVRVLANRSMADPSQAMAGAPALGLVVLSNFLPAGEAAYEGFIYDREAVQTYRCSLSLDGAGHLVVRGYLGWHVFGKTQLWTRAAADAHSRAAGPPAPEFAGIERWLNSEPLTLAGLRGKVVLVDFWTLGCVNCIHALPHVEKWWETYRDRGLVVVGVHTPETPEEAQPARLAEAVHRFGLQYPIAHDANSATWKAWDNHYWPAAYLVDAQGRIAGSWTGEGSYAEIEASIKRLLAGSLPQASAAAQGP